MGRRLEPAEQRAQKAAIASYVLQGMRLVGLKSPLLGPVGSRMDFMGAHPLSDLDNLAKLVLDALNGVAWEDDRQVCLLHARKISGASIWTRTEVEIWTMDEKELDNGKKDVVG